MNLFLPADPLTARQEDLPEAIRCYLAEQGFLTTARLIRRLVFRERGETFDLRVGGRHPGVERRPPSGFPPEDEVIRAVIFAILESHKPRGYLVCTPYRGVIRGRPFLVAPGSVTLVGDQSEARRD
jgi:hypothetical protein